MIRNLSNALRVYFKHRLESNRIGRKFSNGNDLHLIEVFDVIIKSKYRLQLFDLNEGIEILLNPKKSNYLACMEEKYVKKAEIS